MEKRNSPTIVAAIACGLAAACLIDIHALNNKIQDMERSMGYRLDQITQNVGNIEYNIGVSMKEQANLLALENWEYGDVDLASRTIKLYCELSPKEYSPEKTEAVLLCNNREYPMALSNGKYAAEISIPLCEDSVVESVVFKEDGTNRTQNLEWHLSPRYEYLPLVTARLCGSSTGSFVGDVYQYYNSGLVEIDVDQKENGNKIREINLISVLDGKETERIAVDLSYDAQTSYINKGQSGNSRDAMPDQSSYEKNGNSRYYYYLDKNWKAEIPKGSVLELYAEAVDSYGLHYRALYDVCEIDEKGSQVQNTEKWWLIGAEPSIRDEKGNILYEVDETQYQ